MILNNQVQEEDFNVKLAVLKLLEVISIKNPELFYLNYWVLGFDNIGVNYKSMADKTQENIHTFPSPFCFVPFFSKLVKKQTEVRYKTVQNQMSEHETKKIPREWIITENKVDSEEDLSEIALRFLNYMASIEGKSLGKIENIDEIVIEDFKRLNDFSVK